MSVAMLLPSGPTDSLALFWFTVVGAEKCAWARRRDRRSDSAVWGCCDFRSGRRSLPGCAQASAAIEALTSGAKGHRRHVRPRHWILLALCALILAAFGYSVWDGVEMAL